MDFTTFSRGNRTTSPLHILKYYGLVRKNVSTAFRLFCQNLSRHYKSRREATIPAALSAFFSNSVLQTPLLSRRCSVHPVHTFESVPEPDRTLRTHRCTDLHDFRRLLLRKDVAYGTFPVRRSRNVPRSLPLFRSSLRTQVPAFHPAA